MKTFSFLNLAFLILFVPTISFSRESPDTASVTQLLRLAMEHRTGNLDSMLFYSQEAVRLSVTIKSDDHLSRAYQHIAGYYLIKENYGKATEYFLNALRVEEKRQNTSQIANLYDKLGGIYYTMEKFQKSMDYYTRAFKIYQSQSDSINIAKLLCHIGRLHGSREYCETRSVDQKRIDYYTALDYFRKSEQICARHKSEHGLVVVYLNYASVYNRLEKPEKALPYVLKARDYYKKVNDTDGLSNTLYNLGITYRRLKEYQKSIECFEQTIAFAKKQNMTEGLQFVYEALAQTYEDAGDFKKSLYGYKNYMIMRDSVYNAEKSKQLFELETKYQSERNEKQILALTLEKNKKEKHVYLLLSAVAILGLSSFYFIYRSKSKATISEQNNRINEQRIKEMEKERQLIAVHAVLHGEETERSRLARDLHDGLGGLLSGLKLALTNMKGNVLLSEKNVDNFNHALKLLDTSMKELRRVAHNMMPEALTKFGLKEALADFCSGIRNESIEIKFRFYGDEKRLDRDYEINLYRIAQELVNNSMKHSNATEIILMIVQEEKRIHLTVQDNGTGFDPASKNEGFGIENIKSRTESLNGKLEMFSEAGRGTEVNVEFNI